ncbi:xanthine dehydrogenase [Elysia marginata]|uniref:Xanthine dehydrogenase n=1 Tax=Elysia marginata TaxID=1093978 RepID=A0AAV4IV74_9GAST|nr:xanthine dehydrogenase [Elysia marginata]
MIVSRLGGGFGGKFLHSCAVAAASAVAAEVTQRPVRLRVDLSTDMQFNGKRFPIVAKYKSNTSPCQRVDRRQNPAKAMKKFKKKGRRTQGQNGEPSTRKKTSQSQTLEARPQYEAPQPKPQRGSCAADVGKGEPKQLSICTYNTRSLSHEDDLERLQVQLINFKWDIVGLKRICEKQVETNHVDVDQEIEQLEAKRKELRCKENKTTAEKIEYTEINKTVKKKRRAKPRQRRKDLVISVLEQKRGPKQTHKNGNKKKISYMKDKEEKTQTDRETILQICKDFYEKLYEIASPVPQNTRNSSQDKEELPSLEEQEVIK